MAPENLSDVSIDQLIEMGIPLVHPVVIEGIEEAIAEQQARRRREQPTKYEQMLTIFRENLNFGLGDTDIGDEIIPLFEDYAQGAKWATQNRITKLNQSVLRPKNVVIVRIKDDIYRPTLFFMDEESKKPQK